MHIRHEGYFRMLAASMPSESSSRLANDQFRMCLLNEGLPRRFYCDPDRYHGSSGLNVPHVLWVVVYAASSQRFNVQLRQAELKHFACVSFRPPWAPFPAPFRAPSTPSFTISADLRSQEQCQQIKINANNGIRYPFTGRNLAIAQPLFLSLRVAGVSDTGLGST